MLEEKITKRKARIAVIGMGYVGLPIAIEMASCGFEVVGIDCDKNKVKKINSGENYIRDVNESTFRELVKKKKIWATLDYSVISRCDIAKICVPTPITACKDPDISYIVSATEGIAKYLHRGMLIILKSTTFPETTEKVVLPILEKTGLNVGKDFFLSFSPERIDPGNKKYTVKNTPVVVGGVTEKCTKLTKELYKQFVDEVVVVSTPKAAEMVKLLENIFRSVNIALVNEMACLCERMGGIDIWEVIDAAATKPFGFLPFYPGPGLGGHCIPIDPYYLAWKAREYDFHTDFIELSAKTNENMPYFVADKVIEALSKNGIPASLATVLVLGVAFKKDIDDIRSSPAIKIMEILDGKVKNLIYNDPYVPNVNVNGKKFKSFLLNNDLLKRSDCILIATNHSVYDYKKIAKNSRLIVDTRNAINSRNQGKIVRLGVKLG